jgi:hypothetical protein
VANDQQKGAGGSVTLRERYLIHSASPLPDLATPSAQAFAAEDRRDPNKALFALIVRPGFPSRVNVMRALKGSECSGLMALIEWGVVDWPPANRKVMAVVYERPLGGRVVTSLNAEIRRLDEPEAARKLINPAVEALRELRAHNVSHRAIRPTNMFWSTPEMEHIVLGDAATAPPALEQPVLLEPIESAMALPAGRGEGTSADDVYSFGASLALMMRGRNPAAAMDDEAIVRRKMVQGSYGLLVGEERLPLAMIEVLRGTLCDDPQERWNNESLDLWLSGRRQQPLLPKVEKRAARAFSFNGKEYFTARELAAAFCRNWEAAGPYILDGRLELWLRRSLDHKAKADAVAALAQSVTNPGSEKRGAVDVVVARVCMILDTEAPIRYKGLSAMPNGFGPLLALTMIEGGDVRPIVETIVREIPKAWLETRDTYSPDNSMIEQAFRGQKSFLDRGTIGTGVERVLYELNESMPCISPFTVDDYVIEIRDLLPALNSTNKKGDGKVWPIDRHIAAFIGARSNFDVDRQLSDITLPDPGKATMAMLNLLAVIQWRVGQSGLFGLASWVGGLMQPAINSFHSREKRRALEKEIPQIVREGSLVDLARLLDSPEERFKDSQGFEQARLDWSNAAREINDISVGRTSNREEALRTGHQLAALISVTIALVTVSLMLLRRFV